jgi:predicted nucleotidyltransferase
VEPSDLLRKVAQPLEKLGVRYAVVGSMASTVYGELRLTNDIDVVMDLRPDDVELFCSEFPPPEFYLSKPAVESAVRKQFQFNIIHPSSGLKVDCIIAGDDSFNQNQLDRAVSISREGGAYAVRVAAPEDVILKKMEYFRLGQSEKHVRDICGILKGQGDRIDREYIRQWAGRMGLTDIWDAIVVRMAAG